VSFAEPWVHNNNVSALKERQISSTRWAGDVETPKSGEFIARSPRRSRTEVRRSSKLTRKSASKRFVPSATHDPQVERFLDRTRSSKALRTVQRWSRCQASVATPGVWTFSLL
jgi:hypothetical protein